MKNEEMGMTDNQFKSFVRFLIKDIKRIMQDTKDEETKKELQGTIDDLTKSLED